MTILLTFRDNLKAFYSRYDYILTPFFKCVLAIIIFFSLNRKLGNVPALDNSFLLLLLAVICAFIPVEFMAGIAAVMLVLQTVKVSLDVGLVTLAVIAVFYFGYMRFDGKSGVIVLLVPVFYACHMIYALPIVLGFLVGPSAVIPVIFGVVLYYYEGVVGELQNVLAAVTEEDDAVAGYQYILNELLNNKDMVLIFVVFAGVILVTYAIYRMSFDNSWIAAFCVGGFLNVVLFLFGSVTLAVTVEIAPILLGSVLGIVIAVIVQFIKGIVDYQKADHLQFEDDEYYYYVKAIPKLSISESNKNVKHINSKKHE
ncbi:MAG: hypothetical protein K2L07_03100 [Lachnospiraceae bacterium]|nr:hypothetical protein [Lachnospiraceae bacterium]